MQAEYKTDMALLGRQLAEAETRSAQRETANTRWIVATIAVAAGLIIAAIKLL